MGPLPGGERLAVPRLHLLLVGAAAIASAAASYILLRGMRDEITAKLVARHEARSEARRVTDPDSDEAAEDAEVDQVDRVDQAHQVDGADQTDDPRNADR